METNRLSKEQWIKKIGDIHIWNTIQSWGRRNPAVATTQMKLETIMLIEMSDKERQILYNVIYMLNLKKPNRIYWR